MKTKHKWWLMVIGLLPGMLNGVTVLAAERGGATPAVKRATSGTCYARGERGYDDARSFKPFDSIQACLDAGGRLPNLKGFFNNGQAAPATISSAPPAQAEPAAVGLARPLFDTDDKGIVKKSRDGLCYEAGNSRFMDVLHFAAYRNLQDCLQDGGRKPE